VVLGVLEAGWNFNDFWYPPLGHPRPREDGGVMVVASAGVQSSSQIKRHQSPITSWLACIATKAFAAWWPLEAGAGGYVHMYVYIYIQVIYIYI